MDRRRSDAAPSLMARCRRTAHRLFLMAWPVLRYLAGLALVGLAAWVLVSHGDDFSGLPDVLDRLSWGWILLAVVAEIAVLHLLRQNATGVAQKRRTRCSDGPPGEDDLRRPGPGQFAAGGNCCLGCLRIPLVSSIRGQQRSGRLVGRRHRRRVGDLTHLGGHHGLGPSRQPRGEPRPRPRHRRHLADRHRSGGALRLRTPAVRRRFRTPSSLTKGLGAAPGRYIGPDRANRRLDHIGATRWPQIGRVLLWGTAIGSSTAHVSP